jgi:hypothetical protein
MVCPCLSKGLSKFVQGPVQEQVALGPERLDRNYLNAYMPTCRLAGGRWASDPATGTPLPSPAVPRCSQPCS